MSDPGPLSQWRKFYGAPDVDEDALIAETQERFLLAGDKERQAVVSELRDLMCADDIPLSERAERVALHRKFFQLHGAMRRLGR
jgi:hypothetical protein